MNDIPNAASDILQKIMLTAKAAVPESLSNDVKENIKAAIQDVMSELDVVTREELNVQKAVLAKTRAKVEEMERVISELEKKLQLSVLIQLLMVLAFKFDVLGWCFFTLEL